MTVAVFPRCSRCFVICLSSLVSSDFRAAARRVAKKTPGAVEDSARGLIDRRLRSRVSGHQFIFRMNVDEATPPGLVRVRVPQLMLPWKLPRKYSSPVVRLTVTPDVVCTPGSPALLAHTAAPVAP